MKTFGERLQVAMSARQFTPTTLAKEFTRRGYTLSRQAVEGWLKMERAKLTGEHLSLLGLVVGFSIIWMALGIGSPEPLGMANQRQVRLQEV